MRFSTISYNKYWYFFIDLYKLKKYVLYHKYVLNIGLVGTTTEFYFLGQIQKHDISLPFSGCWSNHLSIFFIYIQNDHKIGIHRSTVHHAKSPKMSLAFNKRLVKVQKHELIH